MPTSKSQQLIAVAPLAGLAIFYTLVMLFDLNEGGVYASPELLFALNTTFLTASGLVVAFLSARSYLTEGSLSLLLLGLATATGGVSASIAGLAADISVNYNVAIFDLGFLFSGVLQLLSAILIVAGAVPSSPDRRKPLLGLGYLVVACLVFGVTSLVAGGFAPTFFEVTGPTAIRQWIIGSGALLFASSFVFFGWQYFQTKSRVLFWYTLALAFMALSLFSLAVYKTPNSVFNWTGRMAYCVSGVYFLMAVLRARPESGSAESGALASWAEAFRGDKKQLETLFSKMLNGFSFHQIVVENGKPVDYVFLAVNDAFEEMTGLKRKSVIGKRATKVLPGIEKDPADWIGVYGKVALTGQPVKFENYSTPLDKWYSVSAYSPRKGYFVTIFEDITERKRAEEDLKRRQAEIQTLFENIPAGLVLFEAKSPYKVLAHNKYYQRLFDEPFRSRGMVGLNIYEYAPEVEASGVKAVFEEVAQTKKTKRFLDFPYKSNPPNQTWFNWYIAPIIVDENIVALVSMSLDVTDRHKADLTLREAQAKLQEYSTSLEKLVEERTKQLRDSERLAAIGTTAGMVGHDVRNPLQAIVGDLYLAKSDLAAMPEGQEKEGLQESLVEIEKNVEYIDKIVQDLQDFAKPLKPVAQEMDIEEFFKEVLFKNNIPENIDTICEVEENAKRVISDPDMLKRILSNLMNNAVQAMPNGGKLEIKAFLDAADLLVTVADTGVGIPKDIRPKLFTPLFTTKSRGQGFGLAVIKRMTEALGGKVTFESKTGKGTKFILRFPRRAKR